MSTYPPRRLSLVAVVEQIAPQVDRLNVVLNEYSAAIPELIKFDNVCQILPQTDTKDVGKFLPDTSSAQYVLTIDDDIIYPVDYVEQTIERFSALGESGFVGSYHGSLYYMPQLSWRLDKFRAWIHYSDQKISEYRHVSTFYNSQFNPLIVDQIGTGVAIVRGVDFPPFSYMESSQKFTDVRFARWCFEHKLKPVTLPRQANWLRPVRYEETIYKGFTQESLKHVSDEIASYAFKVPGRGNAPQSVETIKWIY